MWSSFVLIGCEKFLEKKTANNMSLLSTLEDVESVLANTRFLNFNTSCQGEAASDDLYIPDKVYNTMTNLPAKDLYIWERFDHEQASSPWGKTYETVFNANMCLKALEEIPNDPSVKDRWNRAKSEALVFRANAFLRGIWIWGKAYRESTAATDLGIVLKVSPDVNDKSVRATVKDSYLKIIDDLNLSLPFLPEKAALPVTPSKAAVYGLLSRTYLSMADYTRAEMYADSCLAIQNDLLDFNIDIELPTATSSTNPFDIFNKEVVFSTLLTTFYFAASPTYAVIAPELVELYETEDLRRLAYFRTTNNGSIMRGHYSKSSTHYFTGISTAEMLLTKSECLVRKGDTVAGLMVIKKLWEKRYVTGKSPFMNYQVNKDEALKLVLKERRKELVMRSLRWMDVKRLNAAGENIVLKRVVNGDIHILLPNDDRYALPIPSDIIRLTGMKQN